MLNLIGLLQEAERIGYPVVLKPQCGNKGQGVILNIKDQKQLVDAYVNLRKNQKDIILEKYFEGSDYRVCVVKLQGGSCIIENCSICYWKWKR